MLQLVDLLGENAYNIAIVRKHYFLLGCDVHRIIAQLEG